MRKVAVTPVQLSVVFIWQVYYDNTTNCNNMLRARFKADIKFILEIFKR